MSFKTSWLTGPQVFDIMYDEPPFTETDFQTEVDNIIKDGLDNKHSVRSVADQIERLSRIYPQAAKKAGWDNYAAITQMVKNEYNVLHDGSIKKHIFKNLEHGKLTKVNGIVLHQTNSSTARSTLKSYKNQQTGAHFLIAKDGTIYQTAGLDKMTYHVGRVRPRCMIESSCDPKEKQSIETIGFKPSTLHRREMKKPYPERYPANNDSIGIEVVGRWNKTTGYEAPTKDQTQALEKLVGALQTKYNLSDDDVYKHGVIAYKQPSEAKHLHY